MDLSSRLGTQILWPARARVTLFVAAVTLGLGTASIAWGGLRGSGKFVDESRAVEPFHAVEVSRGIQLQLAVGPQKALELHGEDNILPLVETEVRAGTLHVRFSSKASSISDSGVTVKVTAPQLDRIEASGGAGASGEVGPAETLRAEASGGAELHLSGLSMKSVSLEASGGATLELAGRADEVELEVSGGARYPLQKLAAQKVRIDGSGGCDGAVSASDSVRGSVSGGTSLKIVGGAKAHVSSSGGSSVDVE